MVAIVIVAHAASLLAGNALIGSDRNIEKITQPMVISVPIVIATASPEASEPVALVAEPEPPGESDKGLVEEPAPTPPLPPLANKAPLPAKPVTKKMEPPVPQPSEHPLAVSPTPPETSQAIEPLGLKESAPDAATWANSPAAVVSEAAAVASAKSSARPPENVEKQPNLTGIRDLIVANLTFPVRARKLGLRGKLVVAFDLAADGEVTDIAIRVGSGHDILDDSVIATIRRLSPFPKPEAPARLEIPIHFNLR